MIAVSNVWRRGFGSFRVQQRVQRLLDRAAHHPVQVPFDPLVVDPDDVVQRRLRLVGHVLAPYSGSSPCQHQRKPKSGPLSNLNCAKLSVRHQAIACAVAPAMALFASAAAPMVWVLDASTRLVFRLFGQSTESASR